MKISNKCMELFPSGRLFHHTPTLLSLDLIRDSNRILGPCNYAEGLSERAYTPTSKSNVELTIHHARRKKDRSTCHR